MESHFVCIFFALSISPCRLRSSSIHFRLIVHVTYGIINSQNNQFAFEFCTHLVLGVNVLLLLLEQLIFLLNLLSINLFVAFFQSKSKKLSSFFGL